MTSGAQTTGIDVVKARFDALAALFANPLQPMTKIGEILRLGVNRQFEQQGAHWGPAWEPMTPVMKWIRNVFQGQMNARPMIASGGLRKSFLPVVNGPQVLGPSNMSVTIGTPLKYAKNVHLGIATGETALFRGKGDDILEIVFKRVTARPIIPTHPGQITAAEKKNITKALIDAIKSTAMGQTK